MWTRAQWNGILIVALIVFMGAFAGLIFWQVLPVLKHNNSLAPQRPDIKLKLVQPSQLSTGQEYVLVAFGQGEQDKMNAFVQLPRGPSVKGKPNQKNQLQALAVDDAPLNVTYTNPNGSVGGASSAVWTWTGTNTGTDDGWFSGYMKWVAYPKGSSDWPGDVFISPSGPGQGVIPMGSGDCSSTSPNSSKDSSGDGPCTAGGEQSAALMTFFKATDDATSTNPFVTMSIESTASPVQYAGNVTITDNGGCVLQRASAESEGSVFFIYSVTRGTE